MTIQRNRPTAAFSVVRAVNFAAEFPADRKLRIPWLRFAMLHFLSEIVKKAHWGRHEVCVKAASGKTGLFFCDQFRLNFFHIRNRTTTSTITNIAFNASDNTATHTDNAPSWISATDIAVSSLIKIRGWKLRGDGRSGNSKSPDDHGGQGGFLRDCSGNSLEICPSV